MSMIEELSKNGIQLRHHRPGNQKVICPRCSHSRKQAHQKDPCLSLTINDAADYAFWNCHNCIWSGSTAPTKNSRKYTPAPQPQNRTYKKPEMSKQAYTSKFPPEVMEYLTNTRKISPAVIEKSKMQWLPGWGDNPGALCWPFLDERGETVNVKHRNWKEKSKMWMTADAKIIFYGMEDIKPDTKEVIIVEGEFDRLAVMSAGVQIPVLSVPHGAPAFEVDPKNLGTKWDFLNYAEDMLRRCTKVIIAVDSDEKGKFLQNELVRRIGIEKSWLVTWPDNMKDANDTLIEAGADMVCYCVNDAKQLPVNGLYTVEDFQSTALDFFLHGMQRGLQTGWSNVDSFYTVMTQQITVVTGVPNSGKSEWLDALSLNLAKYNDWKFAVFSPENGKEQHLLKLVEKIEEKPTDPKNPERMSQEDFVHGMRWVASRYFFIVAENEKELPTLDWILAKARAAVIRHGIKGLIIDPYNEIEHTIPKGMQETTYISQMLSRLKKFAKANDIHVWIIAHPAKMQKDKDGNVMLPGLYDISGSANWVNKCDNGIVVHRNATPNVTEVHIKKIRFKHIGRQGMTYLLYNRDTGTYSIPESEAQYTSTSTAKRQKKESSIEVEHFDSDLVVY